MKKTTDIILIILVIGAIIICISSYNTTLKEESEIDHNTYYVSNNVSEVNNTSQSTVNAKTVISKINYEEYGLTGNLPINLINNISYTSN